MQFEGDISYAGLNQLLLPLLDDLDVLDPVHRDALRVAAEARGNPLALVELPTALSAEQRATLAAVPAVLPLSERLQALFASRVAEPPARSRELLLLAALDGTGDLTGYPLAVGVLPGQARSFRAAQTVVHAPPARAPVRGLRG